MCFHASQTKSVPELEKRYDSQRNQKLYIEDNDLIGYHLNGYDHPEMFIIPQESKQELHPSVWGIIDPKEYGYNQNEYYKTVKGGGLNARSEKMFTNRIYNSCIMEQRCIIPLTGFFEPHKLSGDSYPFYFTDKKQSTLSVAGIYSKTIDGLISFTMLTKPASPLFQKIHNTKEPRQIILFDQELETEWLQDNLTEKHIKKLINIPFDDTTLNYYSVSKQVINSHVHTNYEEILNPVEYPELIFMDMF